jgi:hypothetical protein
MDMFEPVQEWLVSFEALSGGATRMSDLAQRLRSGGAPREDVTVAEEAADLLVACAAERRPPNSTEGVATYPDDPSPETAGVTWLGG